ncbi:MAG: DsrE family protein [bacterium]|nr:DsrE family protein [bacterium]
MNRRIVVLVRQAGLGHVAPADAQFGTEMLDRFLHSLEARPVKPQAVCFYTEGVKLVCQGSSVVESLKLLEGMGVRVAACGTCLDYFGLRDQVAVGEVIGMNEIVAMLMEADLVLTV